MSYLQEAILYYKCKVGFQGIKNKHENMVGELAVMKKENDVCITSPSRPQCARSYLPNLESGKGIVVLLENERISLKLNETATYHALARMDVELAAEQRHQEEDGLG